MRFIVLVLLTVVSIVLIVKGLTLGVTECTTTIANSEVVRQNCSTSSSEQLYAITLTVAGGGLLTSIVWTQLPTKQ